MFELSPLYSHSHDLDRYFDPFDLFFARHDDGFRSLRTDIEDKGDSYELKADLPGFDKKDISIEITGDTLTIGAKHSSNDEVKKEGKVIRSERYTSSYKRSFDISGIDADNITADYRDGVLTLQLPKEQPKSPESRRIELE